MPRTPITSTYRIQLRGPKADAQGRAFGFAEAAEIVPYLHKLGVSHVYCSPILAAAPESNHGYDVIDPTTVNPELGGIEGFRALADVVHEHGMGLVIDIVPNHVGIDNPRDNAWWWDVLKRGQDSEFESYFDIDWHEDNGAEGKLGLPVLGAEGDEDKLEFREVDGETVLAYYDNIFPIDEGTLSDDPLTTYRQQHYKLMYWRDGVISYRRFFSVNGLAGIRQEDPLVFEHTHRVIRQLCAEGLIDGIRVDHPDGLSDPFGYLKRLRDVIGDDRWLVVEKILDVHEPLDARLAADGTTGYDALRELDGVFLNRRAEDALSMLALEQSGSTWNEAAIEATEHTLKRDVAADELSAEVRRLARALRRDNFSTVGGRVSDEELFDTIVDLVAAMPVYRADYLSLSRVTATIVADMGRRFPSRRNALDLISAGLLADGEAKIRFAQVCGAVMAKGVEDTTFYRACRLVPLQEVGGAPGRFGVSAAEFHLLQQERSVLWPKAMTTLTTHDTKRGEDVRARILSISETPTEFAELVREVLALTPAPDSQTGLFLLQNLLGIWPEDGEVSESLVERFHAYAEKAMREASVHTTWTDPDAHFEDSIHNWINALVNGPASPLITSYVQQLAPSARVLSVGRKLLQLIGPGIPDIYQGNEFFDDSLVDPDNRRFVDYTKRGQYLHTLTHDGLVSQGDAALIDATPDMVKLAVVHESLTLRREHPEYFIDADYQSVFAQGPAENHLVGMARGDGERNVDVIALATRTPLLLEHEGGWGETTITLPEGQWRDRFTGREWQGTVAVAELFATLPISLLEGI
ncbi:Maltooligosyl trehalose synthase [Corynebacterium ciconiae DSM 44920]|uniref:malto-oligosyltrehalose synthase n=1 Tax=Corynebacterium ciconiae TaxID=227319 RepID=UPI00037E4D1A|nr:malto-oligosyltrehalose synthase [Corynebacterium ciconiae]WKD60814.1 Maltooligosyl trehalose synthase [Corynebacterium ciconiae DSM 44920]